MSLITLFFKCYDIKMFPVYKDENPDFFTAFTFWRLSKALKQHHKN